MRARRAGVPGAAEDALAHLLSAAALPPEVAGHLLRHLRAEAPGAPEIPPATNEEMEYFYGHLEQVLADSGFLDPDNPRTLMRRLRRLFIKSQPDQNEINILRGILTSFARALERNPRP